MLSITDSLCLFTSVYNLDMTGWFSWGIAYIRHSPVCIIMRLRKVASDTLMCVWCGVWGFKPKPNIFLFKL